ncbi:carbohydrate kinase family protein [Phaeobacter sp. C3_T13_0]|uniref:carbohydrate kinase family protein n=1 Tax=Phaeobacter cretensis TaxID=3342641 RepID=UPI0039BCE664
MILCCGEALIDMIPTPVTDAEKAKDGADAQMGFVPHCGGAVFNTSVALGRLGQETGLFSGLSRDLFGRQLISALKASNVDPGFAEVSDQPTTLAFVHLKDGHAEYHFFDENSAGANLRPERLPELPDNVSALFFGGISLCNGAAAEAYAKLAVREKGERIIMIDPNVRAGFATDEVVYRQRLTAMIATAGIVKVSDEDLNWIYPGNAPIEEKIQQILKHEAGQGPGLVILTLGSKGAKGFLRSGPTVEVPAQAAEVVDTVGAGDTFNAGFLAAASEAGVLADAASGEIDPEQLRGCLGYGAHVAAVTVSRPGANPPWRAELVG